MECIWPNKHRGTWIGRGEVLVPHSPMHAYGTLVTNDDRALAKIVVRVRIGYQNVGISHSLLGHGRVWGWRADWARCSRPRPGCAAAGMEVATCRSGGWRSTTRQREPYMVDPVSRFSGVHSCAVRNFASLPTIQFLLLQVGCSYMLLLGWHAILFSIVCGSGLQGMHLVVTKWRCQFRIVSWHSTESSVRKSRPGRRSTQSMTIGNGSLHSLAATEELECRHS